MSIPISILRAAQVFPRNAAIRHAGRDISWAEAADRIARLAGGLRGLGLRPGEALAILSANVPENMEITYAAIWAGIVIVPLNTRLSAAELDDILRRSGSRFLAYDRRNAARAAQVGAPLAGLIALEPGEGQPGGTPWGRLLDGPAAPMHDARPEDLLGVYYTGGTTGTPKGVELTHNAFHVSTLDIQIEVRFRPDDVYLHAAPFFHLADCGLGHALTYAGGTHCFLPEPVPGAILQSLGRDRLTALMAVPTSFHDLLNHIPEGTVLPEVRHVVYGAAAMSVPLLRRMMRVFPNGRFVQFYGQTELCGGCNVLRPEDHHPDNPRLATVGRAMASAQVRIADAAGNEAPRGAAGEIQVKGYIQMRGYKDDPVRTAETFADGWLRTGDVGVMDEAGYVAIVDRTRT